MEKLSSVHATVEKETDVVTATEKPANGKNKEVRDFHFEDQTAEDNTPPDSSNEPASSDRSGLTSTVAPIGNANDPGLSDEQPD